MHAKTVHAIGPCSLVQWPLQWSVPMLQPRTRRMFVGLDVGVYVGVDGRTRVLKHWFPIIEKVSILINSRVLDYIS
jgi:hypothetical protein